ncbi:proline/glycine betaine ABC transporter permease [Azospirillum sp. SYSU D00513]|uniref:ABC transporter permease n=1 Tax=Azospirillum sp. SYSU D00513 TaxID=2812561 RepID=UPI001A969A87|nr:proline/glycine betaine ABC transporter permease [Azospirillum sp. SYSU D00513]
MEYRIPLGQWAEAIVDFLLDHAQGGFDAVDLVVGTFADGVTDGLAALPSPVLGGLFVLLGLWRLGWRFALFTAAALLLIGNLGLWDATVDTLALVLTSTVLTLLAGIPLGVWAGRNDRVDRFLRPTLDFMQTMPAFVYLIPAAMFFGLGKVPGAFATIIFAMPPAVRLTSLGIRQVPRELVEAGQAFGCSAWQLLFKVQMPTALPSIMAGVNQTMMMALSMVVVSSMIGAGGLGNQVLSGIQRLDVGLGFESGLAVVLLAILLDRITQSFGTRSAALDLRALLGGLRRPRAAGAEEAPAHGDAGALAGRAVESP